MLLPTSGLRVFLAALNRSRLRQAAATLGQSSLLLWLVITLLFLYERTYLIQKAGLPHFVACVAVRLGLLLALCFGHTHLLVPRLLARGRYWRYGLLLGLAVAGYLLLQGGYDHYLFGYVIGDHERAGLWQNLPYNGLVAGWYVLLTYLVFRHGAARPPAVMPNEPASLVVDSEEIVIKTGGEWLRLPVAQIRYARGLKDYTILHTSLGKHVVKGSIGKVAEWLPAGCFLRVHKSYLVARRHIQSVSSNEVKLTGQTLPIGRAYASVLAGFKAPTG